MSEFFFFPYHLARPQMPPSAKTSYFTASTTRRIKCEYELRKWNEKMIVAVNAIYVIAERSHSFLHFHFISAVHIWFISYIINTHFFHGNIWPHNWPAPNVSGFIAQLVEHRMNFFQASLRNCINCVHCDDHFFIFISFPQFIYDLFHISLTLISFTGIYEPTIDLLPTSVAS